MRILFIILLLSQSTAFAGKITLSQTQEKEFLNLVNQWWQGDVKFHEDLKNGEVVAWSDASSKNDDQILDAQVVGLHPRTCQKGLRRISRYEAYKEHMSFVKESSYDEKNKVVKFVIDHTVLPYPMVLTFVLPRITGPGLTEYQFNHGIFTGLKGQIRVASVGNRCLYFMTAHWQGKKTGLPDVVVGTFAQTLTKIGLEHLIRISTL